MFSSAPGQGSAHAVATIPIPCPCIYLLQNIFRSCPFGTVNRSRETVLRILHQLNGLAVIFHLHDANNWSERFIFHYTHLVIHIDQNSRFEEIPFASYFISAC